MNQNKKNKIAIVRGIPDSFVHCISSQPNADKIDLQKARKQHNAYCKTLEKLGLELIGLPSDESLPDCCFTEDTAIVLNELAIISHPKEISRRNESKEIEKILSEYRKIYHIEAPGFLDGGDVIQIGRRLYIGLSERTNLLAINQVQKIVRAYDYEVRMVPVRHTLHLKSACTYIGNNHLLISPEQVDPSYFDDVEYIGVPPNESYCADALNVGGKVLIPSGYPETKKRIELAGFEVITLDTSEIKKADGALTCLSIIFNE